MTTRLEFTFNDEKELSDFLARLQKSALRGAAPETKAKELQPKTTAASIPTTATASSSTSSVKPLEVVADADSFTAFRQAVTDLLAENPNGKKVFKQLLTKKGYEKLSDVPVVERQRLIQDLVWELEADPLNDPDLTY